MSSKNKRTKHSREKMPENLNEKLYYNTVLCQTFSPNGNFLLAGNIYGDVSIYNLPKVLGPRQMDNENELSGPTYSFSAHPDSQVESMVATDNFLVTGTTGEIAGWDWNIILSNKASKVKASWIVQIPADKDSFEKPDVNCMVYCKENQILYLGCGDNKIYVVHLEDGKILRQLSGHKDYIHSLARVNDQLASSSEDGTVRLWDLRKSENTNILTPHLNGKVARPAKGKWIGAVDLTEDWLLCGGGPNLSLWHLRTMEAAMIFDLPDDGIHVAEIYEERIIAGGAMPNIYHLTYHGEILAKVPTSSSTVYNIVFRETPLKLLSIAGSSNNLDICTNFNYREMVLKFA
ncbi:THO complex subunit 6 [Venturia canescens]|uniref:THO complex subunit 6 n=1 Tax=Venturia canescens TaxID=32260 RepID=UPI001C9CEB80|nr:THO complex subunit 6 [Venturia canescens]